MTTKHTPGPWWAYQSITGAWCVATYRDGQSPTGPYIGASHGASICYSVGDDTEQRTRGNEEANARLIAAAPEMLEACQIILDVAKSAKGMTAAHLRTAISMAAGAADAAIAKAEGRS